MKIPKIVFHALAGLAIVGGIYRATIGDVDERDLLMSKYILWAILFEVVNLNIKDEK